MYNRHHRFLFPRSYKPKFVVANTFVDVKRMSWAVAKLVCVFLINLYIE